MGASKEEFTEQREYEANLQNDNSPTLEDILMNRIFILKSTIESQERNIKTLEQLIDTIKLGHELDIKNNYIKK